MFIAPLGPQRASDSSGEYRYAKPYCQCWKKVPIKWKQLTTCTCGEDHDVHEWRWEQPKTRGPSVVLISEDQKQVTFHPFYSSGTAAVRGNLPLLRNNHYYWEVKMLTETYGTDIMIGVGTKKVNITGSQFKFTSMLGADNESYGLSYRGELRHGAAATREAPGFCRGAIVGVRLDLWKGTLEFYINRKPQGICFYNLRKHDQLFPMMCSTAAQSSLRLIYAASWRASLLVDAAKVLAASVTEETRPVLPPGLWHQLRTQFWLTLNHQGPVLDGSEDGVRLNRRSPRSTDALSDMISEYVNGFYVDNVDRDFRLVLWE